MENLIFGCEKSYINDEIILVGDIVSQYNIFVEAPQNIVGFRQYLKEYSYINDNKMFVQNYEVGYFMEMLYEGVIEAFELLNIGDDFIIYKDFRYDLLVKNHTNFISQKLIENLEKTHEKNHKLLYEKISYNIGKNYIKKLVYDKNIAYLCVRNLLMLKNIFLKNVTSLSHEQTILLQSVIDGYFDEKAIETLIKDLKQQIKIYEEKNTNIFSSDLNFYNKILLNIRNYEE